MVLPNEERRSGQFHRRLNSTQFGSHYEFRVKTSDKQGGSGPAGGSELWGIVRCAGRPFISGATALVWRIIYGLLRNY
jgi:hypothetical protein